MKTPLLKIGILILLLVFLKEVNEKGGKEFGIGMISLENVNCLDGKFKLKHKNKGRTRNGEKNSVGGDQKWKGSGTWVDGGKFVLGKKKADI